MEDWVQQFKKTKVVGKPVTTNMQRKMNGSAPSAKASTRNTVRTKK